MEYVIRKKYHGDILFYIDKIENDVAYLRGVYVRILASAPLNDLIYVSEVEKPFYENKCRHNRHLFDLKNKTSKHITGKILHIDSDLEYLKKDNLNIKFTRLTKKVENMFSFFDIVYLELMQLFG